jgi:hypothetical protein
MPTYHSADEAMTAHIAEKLEAAKAQGAAARAEYEGSPAGDLYRTASQLRVLGAAMTADQWTRLHAGENPQPQQPRVSDLPIDEQGQVLALRLRGAFDEQADR